ncbi:MAG: hypothetical protein ACJ71Z_10285 [Aeromicrobium sp.]
MPRRVNMPPADELFRNTTQDHEATDAAADPLSSASHPEPLPPAGPSGRVKHSEKMTVYLTSDELLALEQARLKLRAELGKTIDRGRLVRAALDLALVDLAERGTDSDVARRLAVGAPPAGKINHSSGGS